jgi:DNA-directed RNA polymerase specialized sigma24 family protein
MKTSQRRKANSDASSRLTRRTCDSLIPAHALEPGRQGCLAGFDRSASALDELCRAYWYPIYAFVRRKGNDADRAFDLTQDFFIHLFEKDILAAAREGKGRFRSFHRVVCKNFLVDGWRRKPGGSKTPLSIDARDAEGRYLIEPADNATPEHLFDRAWAMTLLDRVLSTLAARYAAEGKSAIFDQLKVVLTEGKGAVRSAVVAKKLKMSENAVDIANHRLRKEYREILRNEITNTLDDPSDMDDEIRSLFAAIRPGPRNL